MRDTSFAGSIATALLSAGLCLTSACAVNPVTGERDFVLVSEAREIEMGREADQRIVASMGIVDDRELADYVSRLGRRLALDSERPDLPWTFRVLDDPTVNAFALPGGFVYLTRGMLTHLTSEAQVVGILGHEIGHVTARHSVNQMSQAQLANLGLGLGMILLPELQDFGGLTGASVQLLFLKFSRDDERQADELGVRYMATHGYDPAELSSVFAMLHRKTQEEGGGLPSWASSHPSPDDREQRILAMSASYPDGRTVGARDFLTQIDGMVFGANPRHGFFRDGVFHHPDMRFRISSPSGWQGVSGASAVQWGSEGNDAAMVLETSAEPTPRAAADAFADLQGVTLSRVDNVTVNGIDAALAEFRIETAEGTLEGTALFPDLEGRVFAIYGYASADRWPRHERVVEASLQSFARETDRAVLGVTPARLDVVDLSSTTSLAAFVRQYPSTVPAETIALINHVFDGSPLGPGLAKRVTE